MNEEINEKIVETAQEFYGTWAEFAKYFNGKYGTDLSSKAIKNRFHRHKEKYMETEPEDEGALNSYRRFDDYQHHKVINDAGTVGILPDLHEPFCRKGFIEFAVEQFSLHEVDTVVQIGDLVDHYALSRWSKSPISDQTGREFELAMERLEKWYDALEMYEVFCCIGNHDNRLYRKAFSGGLISRMVAPMEEVYSMPSTWEFNFSYLIDDILYFHGEKTGWGALYRTPQTFGMSTVFGHAHKYPGVIWLKNPVKKWFGMNVGSAMDEKAYAAAYAKTETNYGYPSGLGIVKDGYPIYIPFQE